MTMGLLDVLNGMQQGPRGGSSPSAQSSGGGMSPMTMAILALLAYKAVKHLGGGASATSPAGAPSTGSAGHLAGGNLSGGSSSGGNLSGGNPTGGLGDILKGGLGGLLAGGAAGSVISGGLGDLLKQFQQSGHGEVANSWVSPGPNKQIAPGDLAGALGADQISNLMSQSGLSRQDLLNGLSQYLPGVVDHLTPDGRLPTDSELSDRL
jgi:uncharacterized protein YidB (DUF937 family)